jgi:putative peptidoglycan lipid II flippase
VFPRLAAHAAVGAYAPLRRDLVRAFGIVVALSLPALALLVALGRPLIHALFEHGRFDAAAGALTYAALVAYAAGLPAYVGSEVASRGLIALRDTRTPLLTNVGQILGRVALMTLLVGQLGVIAVPLAMAAAASIETIGLATVLGFKIGRATRPAPSRAPAASP